jgi:hypothetical protein
MRRSKRADLPDGRGRLLDLWVAPEQAGEPIGCIATTFTFDPGFFEEQCLARFLGMETNAQEQGAAYLIEREEKLRACRACVVVDRSNAGEARSLGWDLLSVRVPHGCQHAKVALLCWATHTRVIVGSANLTIPGYRSNIEIAGALNFWEGDGEPSVLLASVGQFLRELLARTFEATARTRALALLESVEARGHGAQNARSRCAKTSGRARRDRLARHGSSRLSSTTT